MIYKAIDISEYIIDRFYKHNCPISNLQLQKILYFIQAEFLVEEDRICFYEKILASSFGPMIDEVYNKYKIYGAGSIPFCKDFNDKKYDILKSDQEIINGIVDQCYEISAASLTELTMKQKPWVESYACSSNYKKSIISCDSIKKYFKKEEMRDKMETLDFNAEKLNDNQPFKVIAIDFDDCLFNSNYPDVGTPNLSVIEAVKELKKQGNKIILWTCRTGESCEVAVKACEKYGLTFDAVNDNIKEHKEKFGNDSRKVYADEYWDDKSVVVRNGTVIF